jgi:hypothetical protein
LLFRRIKAHPLFYGFSGLASEVGPFIVEKCYNSIEQLRKIGAIDVHNDGTFAPAAASTVSSLFSNVFSLTLYLNTLHCLFTITTDHEPKFHGLSDNEINH